MAIKTLLFLLALTSLMANSLVPARDIPEKPVAELESNSVMECWNAFGEIKSCSNEIMIFIRDGKNDISLHCCEAINLITHNWWAPMLTALGLTVDQTYILRGYCDEEESAAVSFGPAQAPYA